jgi:predicted Zn-dependent peptidase
MVKKYVLVTFPVGLPRPEALADLLARAELFGMDPRWVDGMDAKIRAVTAADVQRVVRTYFCEKPLLVMVGKRSEIQTQVDSLGKVEVRKL